MEVLKLRNKIIDMFDLISEAKEDFLEEGTK